MKEMPNPLKSRLSEKEYTTRFFLTSSLLLSEGGVRRLLGGDGGFMLANEDVRFDFGQRGGDISLSVVFNDPRRPLLYDRGCFCFEHATWRVERLRDVVDQRWPFKDLRPSISAATCSTRESTMRKTLVGPSGKILTRKGNDPGRLV